MMTGTKPLQVGRNKQRGLTLVELMVSLVISIVIALAAATAYLGTRSTATTLQNVSAANESANLALDMLARDLQMAGFYPPLMRVSGNLASAYSNIKGGAAYNSGLFGCDGAAFNPITGACGATVADAPDSVVVNYFAPVELDPALFSSGFDCLRQPATNDPVNDTRVAAFLPVLVSNRYTLSAVQNTVVTGAGGADRTISSRSFACNGNGRATESLIYQPLYEGMVDMVVRYGTDSTAATVTTNSLLTAAQVSALPAETSPTDSSVTLRGWDRVKSVRICVLTRTPDNIRTQDVAGQLRTYTDCRGNLTTYPINDRTIYKRFEKLVAVRNNIKGNY